MLEDDQLRILRGRLRDGEERPHAEVGHLLAAEHRQLHAVTLRDLARRLDEEVGRAEVAGHHPERAGERVALGDRLAGAQRVLGGTPVLHRDRRPLERGAPLVGGGRRLEVLVLPGAGTQADGDVLHRAGIRIRGVERHRARPQRPGAPRREGGGPLEGHGAIGRGAGPDQQHALRALRAARQVQRLVARAAEVAALEHAAEGPAEDLVEGAQLVGEGRLRRQRDGEQRRVEGGQVGAGERERQGHGLGERGADARSCYMPRMIASPNSDVFTSFAPGICRARS
jgi:hypothetical protein